MKKYILTKINNKNIAMSADLIQSILNEKELTFTNIFEEKIKEVAVVRSSIIPVFNVDQYIFNEKYKRHDFYVFIKEEDREYLIPIDQIIIVKDFEEIKSNKNSYIKYNEELYLILDLKKI